MSNDGPRRGRLRIYLGAAPGVGKTYAMLNEGRRRRDRGTDVVVAVVETHGRPHTEAQLGDLEVVPRRTVVHQGVTFEEMDLDAVLARRPAVALVDELAHTNVPGSRHDKRWRDVDALLAAGIDVISTVNIQHLESVNDVVARITGVEQRETVPDDVVRAADQVELVDMTPEALRRRMAHGNVYAAEKVDVALGNYFREGNLTALRELALLWVADRVDDALEDYRERHGIVEPWETRERVVVALTGAPGNDRLVRRAARIAQRAHGELIGVHVVADSGLADGPGGRVDAARALLAELGGEYREVTAGDVGDALLDVARAENATQIVLGSSRRSRWQQLLHGSVIARVAARADGIDVHVISEPEPVPPAGPPSRRPALLAPLSMRRRRAGWLLALLGLPVLTLVLHGLRSEVRLSSVLLAYLCLAIAVALVGGVFPALVAVVGGFLAADYFFTAPRYTLAIDSAEVLVALVVYVGAAGTVAVLVDRLARLRIEAVRARSEAEAMAALAGSLADPAVVPDVLARVRTMFGLAAAVLYRRDDGAWVVEAATGAVAADAVPEQADLRRPVGTDRVLALWGPTLRAADQRVLAALVDQLAGVIEARRLQDEADRAVELSAVNDFRAALLQAVSHDLRTPLAAITASVDSLQATDVVWSEAEEAGFLAVIAEQSRRLGALVADLLDMARVQAGALRPQVRPVALTEVIPSALAGLGDAAASVVVEVDDPAIAVRADPVLLEQVVANLVDNALKARPADGPVRIDVGVVPGGVDLAVVDRGPGIPAGARSSVVEPFQRVGDAPGGVGVGLGLAIAHGFLEAMGARLELDDTPGGGTTAVVHLPAVTAGEGDEEVSGPRQ